MPRTPKNSYDSKMPAPDFRDPYVKVDKDGNVSTPDTNFVRGTSPLSNTGAMCKSTPPIGNLAQDLVRQFNITKDNIATIGQAVARDYAHIEDVDFDDLHEEMALIVEGPIKVPEEIGGDLMELFRACYRNWNSKGKDHPETLHDKEKFEEKYQGHIPEEIWNLPLKKAEMAFIDLETSSNALGEAVDEVDGAEDEESASPSSSDISFETATDGVLVIPVKVNGGK